MLRVFFPAEQVIQEAPSHTELRKSFSPAASSESLVTLLTRIFSLVTLDESIEAEVNTTNLDFDLALFSTYAKSYRQMMRFMFQSILYRNFRDGRLSIKLATF